jgi:hypothetical protein
MGYAANSAVKLLATIITILLFFAVVVSYCVYVALRGARKLIG